MALSKTDRFLSKAEILGVGVFSPLPRGDRALFRVCFQAVKGTMFGGPSLGNAWAPNPFQKGFALPEYGLESFSVRLRGLSEYGSVA